MTRILLTGSGMVASALASEAHRRGHNVQALPHSEVDMRDLPLLRRRVTEFRPDWIVHTAALTKVDYCQENPREAVVVNTAATKAIVDLAQQLMARVLYFSTDYVFDGSQHLWYESSPTQPLNIYGASKLEGEIIVRKFFRGHVIRTSGVFGERLDGKTERNFFRAIASRYLETEGPISVVNDQHTAVSYAPHLANMTLQLMLEQQFPKIVHLTSKGFESWYGWAKLALESACLDSDRLVPVSCEKVSFRTPRPRNSRLTSEIPEVISLIALHPARQAVEQYFGKVLNELREEAGIRE
ncbi:MAG: SDR family oxidoreductase [bacterium]